MPREKVSNQSSRVCTECTGTQQTSKKTFSLTERGVSRSSLIFALPLNIDTICILSSPRVQGYCTYVVFRIQKRSFVKYSLLRIFLQVEDLGKALRSCHIISFFPRQDQMSIQKEPPRFIAAFIFFRRGEGGATEKSPDHLTKSYGMLTCKLGKKKLLLSVSCGLCPKLQRNKCKYSKLSNFAS